jgi:3-methyladenine DNA glycosylase/8-oxoguanine DNA glycosylase
LDAARLRAQPYDEAVAGLTELPGIGPTAAELDKLSENWRPYRTWVTLLLRAQLEDETGEIRGNT